MVEVTDGDRNTAALWDRMSWELYEGDWLGDMAADIARHREQATESLRTENARLLRERDALRSTVERAKRQAENIGITSGSYYEELCLALSSITTPEG